MKLTFTNKSSLVNIVTTAGEDTEVPRGQPRPIRGRHVAPVTNQRRPVTTASENFLFLVTSEAEPGPGHCFPVTEAASEPGLVTSPGPGSDVVTDRFWPGSPAQVCGHCWLNGGLIP